MNIDDIDKFDWDEHFRDSESICYDCGKPDPPHKIDEGVALCAACKKMYDAMKGE